MASSVAEDLRGEGEEAATTITDIHEDIMLTHILPRLNGPSLASFSCASSSLHLLCSQQSLWTHICHSTWPSTAFPLLSHLVDAYPWGGPRSFFTDAFLLPSSTSNAPPRTLHLPQPERLISFMDIHYKNKCVLSKVEEMRFERTPLDIVYLPDVILIPTQANELTGKDLEEDLRLSWIVADPSMQGRAINVSSRRAVSVKPQRLQHPLEEVELMYTTIMAGGSGGRCSDDRDEEELVECEVTVRCLVEQRRRSGVIMKMVRIWFVSLKMKDTEGNKLKAKDGLVILHGAMSCGCDGDGGGDKMKGRVGIEEGRKRSIEFMERKRREGLVRVFGVLFVFFLYILLMIANCVVSGRHRGFMGFQSKWPLWPYSYTSGIYYHNIEINNSTISAF